MCALPLQMVADSDALGGCAMSGVQCLNVMCRPALLHLCSVAQSSLLALLHVFLGEPYKVCFSDKDPEGL